MGIFSRYSLAMAAMGEQKVVEEVIQEGVEKQNEDSDAAAAGKVWGLHMCHFRAL